MVELTPIDRTATPVLIGSNFRLEPLKVAEVNDRYVGWLNDPQINQYLEVRFVRQTLATVTEYVKAYNGDAERYMWGVYPDGEDEYIGTATLSLISHIHRSGGIGFMIGEKAYWGSGASQESLELLVNFAFDVLGLRRLFAESCAPNHGMNFTFKKMGFTLEGKMREGHYISPGCYVDGYRWGILASEWQERRAQ